ncbi:MAG: hypothetical protein A3E78_14180 [Alphaproteobacteria bacterium RIFCSPHIGHO2_12_FULL_63_12]|nr:MAG: hypothetical protein A3E78_14180 [Alphaproteobacteria bacterium RIFCSPHIGHO2_12_FULL_63_12]
MAESSINVLQSFFETTLKGGSLSFEHPRRPSTGSAGYVFRFTRPIEPRVLSGGDVSLGQNPIWEVDLDLEILP